jgi:hypothetical protein
MLSQWVCWAAGERVERPDVFGIASLHQLRDDRPDVLGLGGVHEHLLQCVGAHLVGLGERQTTTLRHRVRVLPDLDRQIDERHDDRDGTDELTERSELRQAHVWIPGYGRAVRLSTSMASPTATSPSSTTRQ